MVVKEELLKLLEDGNSDPCDFITFCKTLALAYLKKKVQSGNTYLLTLMGSLEDLAWDCIADLFERDESNNFVQFERYFAEDTITELSEQQVQIRLRRLIFSKVNDGIFRNFGVFDLSLSKIIRNLKLAADKLGIPIERQGHHNFLFFSDRSSTREYKPIMPPEFLEIKLTTRLQATHIDIPDVLGEAIHIFQQQNMYQQRYALVQLARIIRRSFVYLHDEWPENHHPEDPVISKGQLRKYLLSILKEHRLSFYRSYVEKGKIKIEILDKYIRCVKRIIEHHYIMETQIGDSYYDHFKQEFPSVSKEEYREVHRQYLEYMVKLIREDLVSNLRKVI